MLKESGALEKSLKKWVGFLPNNSEPDKQVLSAGDVFLAFVFVGMSLFLAMTCLGFEKLTRKLQNVKYWQSDNCTFYSASN